MDERLRHWLMRWVPRVQQDAAALELAEILCEPPAIAAVDPHRSARGTDARPRATDLFSADRSV
jgi:hypothetical protein